MRNQQLLYLSSYLSQFIAWSYTVVFCPTRQYFAHGPIIIQIMPHRKICMNFIVITSAYFFPGDVTFGFKVFQNLKNYPLGNTNIPCHYICNTFFMRRNIFKHSSMVGKKCPLATHDLLFSIRISALIPVFSFLHLYSHLNFPYSMTRLSYRDNYFSTST
jgi:hypothetical protein